MASRGVYYIGTGVSGGYQSARRGPSMSPGGDKHGVNAILPFLERVAAKDSKGQPCVGNMGNGGSGHYVKTIHNGIEQGMLSVLCEAWGIMLDCLGINYDTIGKVLERWNAGGELKNNYLVSIGAQICQQRDEAGIHVLGRVKDKVVQDADESEGTGIWTQDEAVNNHIPSPTLTVAHFFRLASANRAQCDSVHHLMGTIDKQSISLEGMNYQDFLKDLRMAVYTGFLAAYVQGLVLLDKANKVHYWGIPFAKAIQTWRAGCIIQSDYIADLLQSLLEDAPGSGNVLLMQPVIDELKRGLPPLKMVVLKAVEANANVPALSATLEWIKYIGREELPLQFMEAELDLFGTHSFDLKSESAEGIKKGEDSICNPIC